MRTALWNFPGTVVLPDESIVGYRVEAVDRPLGTVDAVAHALDAAYLVVGTGGRLAGRQRLVPAGAVRQISIEARRVFLGVPGAAVDGAPALDDLDDLDDLDLHDDGTRDRLTATFPDRTV